MHTSIDLYSYRIHNLSLVRTYEWKEQRYYFSAFEEYVNIARRLVPRVATIVEIDVFYSIIVRENILFQHGCLNKPAKKEIRSSARACRVNAIKVLKSQNSIKRKLILLIGVVSFPLACFLRRKMVR